MGLISMFTDIFKNTSDAGQNKSVYSGFGDPNNRYSSAYDANAQFYNGSPGGRQAYTNEMNRSQALAEGRAPVQADFSGTQPSYNQTNRYASLGLDSRGQQGQAMGLMRGRATGATPSIAQMQADRQMQQAGAAQRAQMSSARGPAGLALAQQTAANNTANAQSNISNQAQINAAEERRQAEQAYYGAATGMREGDIAGQRQAAQQTQFDAGLGTQQQQFNAQLGMQGRALNDARAQQYEQLKANANAQELNARMQNQGVLAGSYNAAMGANAGTNQYNAMRKGQQSDQMWDSIGSNADEMLSMGGMFSDMRSKKPLALAPGGRQQVVDLGDVDAPDYNADDADAAALDDRYRQNGPYYRFGEPPARNMNEAPTDRERLHGGIEERIAQDRAGYAPTQQDARTQSNLAEMQRIRQNFGEDEATQQWERSNGPAENASAGLRDGGGGQQQPSYGQVLAALFGKRQQTGAPSGQDVQRFGMVSDARAKDEAFRKGMAQGIKYAETGDEKLLPEYKEPEPPKRSANDTFKEATPGVEGYGNLAKAMLLPGMAYPMAMKTALSEGQQPAPTPRQMTSFQRDAAPSPPPPSPQSSAVAQLKYDDVERQYSDERTKLRLDDGPVAEGNRAMVGSSYTYKDEFRPDHEKPGQPHYGFMAQNLAKSPVTATAVEKDPHTGMLAVDRDRMLQAVASGVADLQKQQDETRLALADGGKKRKGK